MRIKKKVFSQRTKAKAFPYIIWIRDGQGRFVMCNEEFEKFLNITVSEVVGKDVRSLPENVVSFLEVSEERTNAYPKIVEVWKKEKKEKVTLEITKRHIKGSHSNPIEILYLAKYVSENLSVGRSLIHSNNDLNLEVHSLRNALENNGVLTWEMDFEGKSLRVLSSGLENGIRWNENPKEIKELIHHFRKEDRLAFEVQLSKLFSREINQFTTEIKLKEENSNDWIWYKCSLIVYTVFKRKILGTLLNINKSKESEKLQILGLEQERMRVARDIHDSIGQLLVGARLMLNQTLDKEITYEKLKEINVSIDKMLGDMIRESRLIINNFGISYTNNGSLKHTFIELAEKMKKVYEGKITIHWLGRKNVDNLVLGINLFKIYQEALTNAIKHSVSNKIEINVEYQTDFFMVIKDYGIGFGDKSINSGFGIQNMKNRAAQIGGEMKIESVPGAGTCVEFSL